MQHGNWRGGGHQGGYQQPPHQADDELAQRLRRVTDTRDAVTDCSRAMLHRTDIRARCISVWRDVFQSAVGERKIERALTLLYVVNDVLQCPYHGYRWQEDFGPHLCDVVPQALACARALGAHDMHQKLTRMPNIWRDRRVLPTHFAERLVDYCYDSLQEFESRQHPQANRLPRKSDSHSPHRGSRNPAHNSLCHAPPLDPAPKHHPHAEPPHQHPSHQHLPHSSPSQPQPHQPNSRSAPSSQLHPPPLQPPPVHGAPQSPSQTLSPPQHQPHSQPHSQPQSHGEPLHAQQHQQIHSQSHSRAAQKSQSQPHHQQPSHGAQPSQPHTPSNAQSHAHLPQHSTGVPAVAPSLPAKYSNSNSNTGHSVGAPVAPDPRQVEHEQMLFDIDEAVGLMQLVKKCVLERKLQVFEQTHTDAKHALEAKLAKHAAAESICVSRYDTARICEMNQKEIANLEVQHEQEAEHLRLQWVMELKVWGDYVALLRERLHHKIPDARWISHLLRKAHRAQRCYETALELEAFLEKYCADPDPVLTLDMWEKPDIWDNPSDNATPLSPQTAALPPPPVAGQPPAAAMLPERDGRSQDSRKDRDTETGQREEDAKRKEKERKKEEERQKKEEEKRRKDKEAADLVDDSCPLYRCKGCDKVFAVRGMLSVSDMQGLNVGTRRYVDSKTARAARDAHRKDAHPHLSCDAPAAVSAQSTTASSASASLSSPRRALETAGNANREREGEVSKSTRAENPPKVPDLGIRFHGAALQQTSAAPKDPRLAKGANAAAASTDLRDTKQASSRHVHTQDFVPASAKGIREDIEGYVYKYGKSGPGYYRIVGSDVRGSAEQSEKSPRSHAAGEYASGGSCSSMNGGAASSSGGKKTIAEMIQDRTRQKEEAEKERVRKEMENQLRLEAEVKLREELRQMKEQLEKDRISQQKQKEAEERERARRQQLEDERLRAELRGLKEQLDRQEREREREWDRRQQNSNSQHDKTGRSPPRPTRMTMEHRMSARLPSPPSPPRERVRRTRDDSDVEDGEIREVSPPRPTLNRHQVDFHRVSSPAASPQVAASHARVDKEVVKAQQTSEALLRSLSAGDGGSENDEMEDVGIAHGGEAADKCKDNSAAKRKGVQDSGKCNSKHHSGGADAERACSPLLPSLRSADEQDEDEDEDVATAHSDDEEKPKAKKGKAKVAKPIAASPATGGGAKRKAAAEQGAQGNSKTAKMSKSAMLKEFSRTEVRAGEALLALYDYYFTAAQQMETARALNGVPPSAAQIGDNLVQKELHDAVAARIQGKWKALKGGLTWYTGSITKLNNDETVDIMYDDNDAEHNVPLRFIQLLDKQPNTPSNSSNSKKRKGPGGAVAAACAKRRLPPAFIGNGTVSEEGGQTQGAGGDAEMQHASGLDAFLGLEDENMQDGKGSSGKKNTKGKARNKAKAARARGGGTARQSKTRLVVQELPDALPEKPLEECLLILNAVLGTKVAAPLMTADTSVLFPLLVKSSIEVLGKNAEKIPMDFVSIKKHLTKTCQARTAAANAASAGGGGSAHTQSTAAAKAVGHYRSAQQVREDVVRIIRLVNESLTVRQAMRVTCTKVFEAFNDLFEARVSPPLHQAGGMLPFQHGLHWLGQRVRVFWKDDFVWYTGCIDDHYGSDRYHIIYDDDGMEEWITLPSLDVHMIGVSWEPKSEQRLLSPGDAVLSLDTRAQELGAPTGVLYQAEVLDTRPTTRNASIRWSRGVWPLPDPDEEEVLSEDEEWMDSEEAKFVRCDTNVGCHYVNGRVQAEDDETVRDLARRYNLEDVKLAYLNKMEHPTISPTSKLVRGTLLLLPLHPTLAQRLPEHALDAVVYPPLPHLASSGQEDGEENLSRGSTFEFVQVRGRMGTRHATRVPQRLYGGMAVRAGACEELLGARVVVECVNSRLLGTVACYDAAKSQYHILLDAHGGSGGLGDVVVEQVVVTTPLPCPDVHVVAAMPRCNIRACSPEEDHALEQKAASGGSRMGLVVVAAAESSPETPPLHAPPAPEPDSMGGGAVADGIGAAQLAALVGMTVTRGFDGVSGKVSTLVPGSDVVIIEWEDGDCEDMHVTDMQRQGLL